MLRDATMPRTTYVYKVLRCRHRIKEGNRTRIVRPGQTFECSFDLLAMLAPDDPLPAGAAQPAEAYRVSPGHELFQLLEVRHYV